MAFLFFCAVFFLLRKRLVHFMFSKFFFVSAFHRKIPKVVSITGGSDDCLSSFFFSIFLERFFGYMDDFG